MSKQHFFVDGRWVSREIMLRQRKEKQKEAEELAEKEGRDGQDESVSKEYKDMEIEDLREVYKELYEKEVANAYKNKKEWIINKIKEYQEGEDEE